MSFDAQLILAALDKHFDVVEARWDRFFAAQDARWAKQDTVQEASKGVPARTQYVAVGNQYAVVGADAVSGYRGDLLDGGNNFDEQRHEELIIADNWGGLFDQSAHSQEERDFEFPDVLACVTPEPASVLTFAVPVMPACVAPVHVCVAPVPEGCLTSTEVDTTSTMPTRCSIRVLTPTPATVNKATTTSASSTPTKALGEPVAAPSTWLHARPAVPTCPLEPAAQGAEEEIRTNTPTKFSIECFSHDTDVLKFMDTITSIWNAPLTFFSFTDDIPLDVNEVCSMVHLQERYITKMFPSLSNAIVLPCVDIGGHEYEKVLECMTTDSTVVFRPLFAYMFDKEEWPLPIYFASQKSNVQLRPIPWPSFWFWKYYLDVHVSIKGGHVSSFPDSASVSALLPYSIKYGWQQWEIPWPYFSCLTARTQCEDVSINSSNSSVVELTLSNFVTGYILQAVVIMWWTGWKGSANVRIDGAKFSRYKCDLTSPKVSVQRNEIQHWPLLVQQLSSIIAVQLLFLWDPGGDRSAGCGCFCLLLLPSTLSSAWWQFGYPGEALVSINPNCFRRQLYRDSSTQKKQCCICLGKILLPLSLIQFYDAAMKLYHHWKYFGLIECCDYESGDLLFINTSSVQKLLCTSSASKLFTANLSSLNGTVQRHMRILWDILQLLNCISGICVTFYLCKHEPDATITIVQAYILLLSFIVGLVTRHWKTSKLISSL
ncbi:unnamed protein product [Urochloa humidicola]